MAPASTIHESSLGSMNNDKTDKDEDKGQITAQTKLPQRPTSIAVLFAKPKKRAKKMTDRMSIFGRDRGSPIQLRPGLSENYEEQASGRESWWRSTIKETPIPGSYDYVNFLKSIEKRPNTYRFKSDGRKIDPHPHGKGSALLPGAYQHQDFLYRFQKANTTYGFKTIRRDKHDFLNFGKKDRDINVSPSAYATEEYLSIDGQKQPSKHSMFKSNIKRFPTVYFIPKSGPAPGNYEYKSEVPLHPISSSFKSRTPRFSSSHTKIPGPGAYEKTFHHPMNANISKMGRQHGLFFSSAFQA